jgi:NCS2 family nucleobase:cation symporter-2
METGFAVAAIICVILNLTLPEELEDDIDAARSATNVMIHEDTEQQNKAIAGSSREHSIDPQKQS